MILSSGALTKDVEVLLNLKTVVAPGTADGERILILQRAVESQVKELIGRKFEEATRTNEPIDVRPFTRTIYLSDRPVTTLTSMIEVKSRDANGAPDSTETIPRKDYLLYSSDGKLVKSSGYWPTGPQAVLANYVAGHVAANITSNVGDEVAMIKGLLGSILYREYKRFIEGIHHIDSLAFSDQSTRFRIRLTDWELLLIESLKMGSVMP